MLSLFLHSPLLLLLCFMLLSFMCYYLSMYQIRNDLQKGFQQHDENTSQAFIKFEQRINNIRVDLNLLEEQINQRITHVSSALIIVYWIIKVCTVSRSIGGLSVFPYCFNCQISNDLLVFFYSWYSMDVRDFFRVNNNYLIKYVINKRIKTCGEEKLIKKWLDWWIYEIHYRRRWRMSKNVLMEKWIFCLDL